MPCPVPSPGESVKGMRILDPIESKHLALTLNVQGACLNSWPLEGKLKKSAALKVPGASGLVVRP